MCFWNFLAAAASLLERLLCLRSPVILRLPCCEEAPDNGVGGTVSIHPPKLQSPALEATAAEDPHARERRPALYAMPWPSS